MGISWNCCGSDRSYYCSKENLEQWMGFPQTGCAMQQRNLVYFGKKAVELVTLIDK